MGNTKHGRKSFKNFSLLLMYIISYVNITLEQMHVNNFACVKFICSHEAKSSPPLTVFLCLYGVKVTPFIIMLLVLLPNVTIASSPAAVFSPHNHLSPVKRICVFEHSVMTNFNCACPAIQRGQGSGFLSEGSSRLTACMSEQRKFWRDCANAQARLNLRCSHRL